MSSLSGAPPLGGTRTAKPAARLDLDRPVTPEYLEEDEDDLFPPSRSQQQQGGSKASGNKSDSSQGKKKSGSRDKEKGTTSKKSSGKKSGDSSDPGVVAPRPSAGSSVPLSKPPLGGGSRAPEKHAMSDDGGDYSEDFLEEDHMPSVFGGTSAIPAAYSVTAQEQAAQREQAQAAVQAQLAALRQREEELARKEQEIRQAEEDRRRREQEDRDRKMREWNTQEEVRRRQEAAQASHAQTPTKGASSSNPSPTAANIGRSAAAPAVKRTSIDASPANSLTGAAPVTAAPAAVGGVPSQLSEQLLSYLQLQLAAQQQQQLAQTSAPVLGAEADGGAAQRSGDDSAAFLTKDTEKERRRRRERDRARDHRKVHDEQAAHTLFHRLSNEVREIFRELNLYVVASERERIKKDEAGRRDREIRDRQEEAERRDREAKDRRDREEKEERFWRQIEEREQRFRESAEQRLRDEEARREERWRQDDSEKLGRTRDERETKEDFLRVERERRDREDQLARERDRATLAAQLDEVKRQYRQQIDEMRQQAELDRQHIQELHKLEMQAMEKRHVEAASLTEKHHKDQLALMDLHTANASKLEKLIGCAKDELDEARSMHDRLTAERVAAMREREQQLAEQHALVKTMLAELVGVKEQMDRERMRIVSLYSQFDVASQSFLRENEEDRRKYREQMVHLDSTRAALEKERKAMLNELHTERRALEDQHSEFVERKMASVSEIQSERSALQKERAEWQLVRERQTRDETELLTSLRHKEETLASRIEAIERDRQAAGEKAREAAALRDEAAHEREQVRRQRADFELEKADVLRKVEDVHRRAEVSEEVQVRLRKELALARAHVDPQSPQLLGAGPTDALIIQHAGRSPPHASAYQLDLARQRAVLNRIGAAGPSQAL